LSDAPTSPLAVGIAGLGTVARGVLKLLLGRAEEIARHAGRPIVVTRVASRTPRPEVDLGGAVFSTTLADLTRHGDVDVVVELIGGETAALGLVRDCFSRGVSVVTANKALLATHGNSLLEQARQQPGVAFAFEAAVAGSIPIINALTRSLVANEIQWLVGIINGTSNYILTAMAERGAGFDEALAEAQRLGYAEADPTFDVEGIDAAHKLTILTALAFDARLDFDRVYTEGITAISADDIGYADELGYRIRHLGIARRTPDGVESRVHPTLIPKNNMLAHVNGVMNAVLVMGDASGPTLHCGAGAGGLPTASSVVADLVAVARGDAVAARTGGRRAQVLDMEQVVSAFYLRIPCRDQPGVFARVATVLSEHDISIEAAIQRESAIRGTDEPWVPIVIVTHKVREQVVNKAIAAIKALDAVVGDITRIRVDHLT
jgi:homoserine dehydrogenase